MILFTTIPGFHPKQKIYRFFAFAVPLLIATNIAADYLYTHFRQSAFYLTESALFSSYWILLIPLIVLQHQSMKTTTKKLWQTCLTLLIISLHLALYPALVGLLSALFYHHTFAYGQTFQFGLSAYLVQSLIIYGFVAITATQRKPSLQTDVEVIKAGAQAPIQTLLVKEGGNAQTQLAVKDIYYFLASPPYVAVHLSCKKHLHTATLKGLEACLDAKLFVRIHRSCLLNVHKIISIQSRKNGDYDVTLTNQTVLRVSRNYAAHFKKQWLTNTQLSAK